MYYQLSSGKTVDMSIEQFLYLSDDDIKHLTAGQYGDERNDPFHGSALFGLTTASVDPELLLSDDEEISLDDLPEQDQVELTSVLGLQSLHDDGDYFSFED